MSNSSANSADTDGPVLVTWPRDGHAADRPLVFVFNESITLAPNASLTVRAGYEPGVTLALADNPAVTVSGATITVQLPQRLAYATAYTLVFSPGAVSDLSGNKAFGGYVFDLDFRSGVSPVALNLTGTPGADRLDGSDLADTIDGGAGFDQINGHGGDDMLYGGTEAELNATQDNIHGGDGNDSLWGGHGDDQLDGGNGHDKLYGEAGNDYLSGGDGDDLLEGGAGDDDLIEAEGNNTLRGGDGDDRLLSNSWLATGLLDGGDGNDSLQGHSGLDYVGGAGDDRLQIDFGSETSGNTSASGGSGKDRFELNLFPSPAGKASISGGAGIDTYVPNTTDLAGIPDVTVTDFAAGAGGDLIYLSEIYTGSSLGNPFADGRLRLLASGADTLLQVRHLATGNYLTVLTLAGLAPAQLTAANFVSGFDPLGGSAGLTLTGTSGNDVLRGARLDDTLTGLGGDDQLHGEEGNDLLEGGDGNDDLRGGDGDDRLRGGDGDDSLSSGGGDNVLDGGAGNDSLSSAGGNDRLAGGAGNDVLALYQSGIARGNTVTMAGDAGNDIIRIGQDFDPINVVASGGDGADLFEFREGSQAAMLTILDFGAADQVDLRALMSHQRTGNPFGPGGYLKAVQAGADVHIHVDHDGAAGPQAPRHVLTLAGVALASLQITNFTGGFDPAGGSRGLNLAGTAGADILKGSELDDTIDGGDGADRINGGAGDDILLGGDESVLGAGDEIEGWEGNDTLRGGIGNDRLDGGAGKDSLYGELGNDHLYGGLGDDLLDGGEGNDQLDDGWGSNDMRGGSGDDTLRATGDEGSSRLDGGAGNDTLVVGGNAAAAQGGSGDDRFEFRATMHGQRTGALRAEGGDGNDTFILSAGTANLRDVVLAGGAGSDRYVFNRDNYDSWGAYTIADFRAGGGGDVLDLYSLLPDQAGSLFASGHVRLLQDGMRVLLQVDRDGAAGPLGFDTRIILENLSVGSLVADNFTEGLRTDGSSTGMELAGGDDADRLAGGRLDDTLRGRGGADILAGNGGDDTLLGGGGDDDLDGGMGNDRLEGGAGNDNLVDFHGNNTLHGGDGNDRIQTGDTGQHQVSGDAGDDHLRAGSSGSYDGGAGNDRIDFLAFDAQQAGTAQLKGGDGADIFLLALNSAALKVGVEGGGGIDIFKPAGVIPAGALLAVTDFAAGGGGDQLDLDALGNPGGRNPFATDGFLQLVQRGADTVLQLRKDGAWQDSLLLQNVAKTALTSANFVRGFDPRGSSIGQTISGTAAADQLTGGWLDDTLSGAGGNDVLLGGFGDDVLSGDDGNDRLDGDRPNTLNPSQPYNTQVQTGHDRLDGGAGDDVLVSRWGNDVLKGGAGNDQLDLLAEPGTQAFNISLDGGDGQDRLRILDSGVAPGSTVEMRGGAGSDSFTAGAAPRGGSVVILDFTAGEGGDVLDVFNLADTQGMPFAGGFYQLEQRGADTVIRFDQDGAAGSAHRWVDLLVLRNLTQESLVAANMRGGYLPGSPAPAPGQHHMGGTGADRLEGDSGNDRLDGGNGNDVLVGGAGADLLLGGAGIDTALFSGRRADYSIGAPIVTASATVADRRGGINDGTDTLVSVERLAFSDGALAFDTGGQGIAGQAYRIYRAAFDRPADEGGLGFWIAMMDRGATLVEIAAGFVRSQEFIDLYGAAPGNDELVAKLYRNILDRDPDPAGYAFWLDALDRKVVDLPSLLAQFSESDENRWAVTELVANGVHYQAFGG